MTIGLPAFVAPPAVSATPSPTPTAASAAVTTRSFIPPSLSRNSKVHPFQRHAETVSHARRERTIGSSTSHLLAPPLPLRERPLLPYPAPPAGRCRPPPGRHAPMALPTRAGAGGVPGSRTESRSPSVG